MQTDGYNLAKYYMLAHMLEPFQILLFLLYPISCWVQNFSFKEDKLPAPNKNHNKLNPQENIVVNNKKSCNEKINDIDISLAI